MPGMDRIADVLFVVLVLGLFALIFWKGLGGSRPRRRGANAAERDPVTDDAASRPPGSVHGRSRRNEDGGSGDASDGGGD